MDYRISDSQITASSVSFGDNDLFGPGNARLIRGTAWLVGINDRNQWIQVYLGRAYWVSGVQIQGRNNDQAQQWVTKFKVQYSSDDVNWTFVQQPNTQTDMVSF